MAPRRKTDYLVLLALAVVLAAWLWPWDGASPFTPPEERKLLVWFSDPLELCGANDLCRVGWFTFVTAFALTSSQLALFFWLTPDRANTIGAQQVRAVATNFVVLPLYQGVSEYFVWKGWTRTTVGRTSPGEVIFDIACFMLWFEILWYAGHRAMHDVKFLWTYGHAFHHTYNKPTMMNLLTNFTFDHIVEPFILMGCSFVPTVLAPGNFFAIKFIALAYMVVAILAHWDDFPYKYHLNHHYYVTYNFGSHVPIFDWLFGTLNMNPPPHMQQLKQQAAAAALAAAAAAEASSVAASDSVSSKLHKVIRNDPLPKAL